MTVTPNYPGTSSTVIPTPVSPSSSSSSSSSSVTSRDSVATNFQAFLQMLTTQLQNQNPLDPLDTNQFTQQLVQFAQVEQQLRANDQLATLVELQKATQSTYALGFVGTTVAVDGATTKLADGAANWKYSVTKPSTVTLTITNATGQTVYSSSHAAQAGEQSFKWDGHGSDGTLQPDGAYKLTVTAKDTNGKSVGVSTEIEGKVESVDLTHTPPQLMVAGQPYTVDKVKRVTKPAS